jgi:hypothetical protein
MNNIILKEDFDSMCIDIYDLLHEFNTYDLNYDEIKEVLIENEFNEYEIMLLLQLYEGAFWDKIKSGARNLKDKAVNVKDKVKSYVLNSCNKSYISIHIESKSSFKIILFIIVYDIFFICN